jgi:hypothetical protein
MSKKPPKKGFDQMKVGDKTPAGFSATPLEVTCTLEFEQNGNSIDFSLVENVPAGDGLSGVIVENGGEYHLAITQDTILTIVLSKHVAWRWHQEQAAITTKKDNSSVYAVVGGFDDPITDSVVLHCKSRGGTTEKIDGFSFSVDLKQSKGSYLPVTIDPDIRNPPPGNGFTPAVASDGGTLSVPLSAAM